MNDGYSFEYGDDPFDWRRTVKATPIDKVCPEGAIFVFGSNESGYHGGGAAATAVKAYGARMHKGFGPQGNSWAIPTKDWTIDTLPLEDIRPYVQRFLAYAKSFEETYPKVRFFVTRIGCGLAGYTDADIGPMFVGAPSNCILPEGWG